MTRLDRNSPITVIRAPRGYGKHTLVRSWLDSIRPHDRAVLWIPEPAAGTTPEEYWESVRNQIRSVGIVLPVTIPGSSRYSAAQSVRESLARSGAPVLLVLVRIDLVEKARFEEEILHLLDRCHNVTVVATACGRTVFGDPVGLEPTHELIVAHDLLYTHDDARELFSHNGIELRQGESRFIHRYVGGLPALMRAAVVAAKSLPDVADRRELLAHRLDTAIDRFVESSLFSDASVAADRDFVEAVAAARVITPEIAQLLTGVDDAAERLTLLETAGVVGHCETTRNEAWEFAPAVRTRLLAVQEGAPSRLALLAKEATTLGDFGAALAYAREAQLWELAADLIEEHWVGLMCTHFRLLHAILRELPAHVLEARPALDAGRDLFLLLDTQSAATVEVLPTEPAALRELGTAANVRDYLSVGCVQSLMLRRTGEHARAAEMTRRLKHLVDGALEARADEVTRQLPVMRLQWGITYQLAGAIAESTMEYKSAYRGALTQGIAFVARNAAGNSAMNWAVIGEPRRAEEWLELEEAQPVPEGWLAPVVKVGGLVARTHLALDRLDFRAAERCLAELGEASELEELWPFVTWAHGRYALATEQPYTGMAVLRRALASHGPVPRPDSTTAQAMTALEAELRLALGEGTRALTLFAGRSIEDPLAVVAAARSHLLTGAPATALAMCRTFDWFSRPCTRAHLEALLVEATAHHILRDEAAAVGAWTQASTIIDRTGLLGALATIPRKLLGELDAATSVPSAAAATFLASDTPEMFPAAVHHIDLTEREHAVLVELARGLSTNEIARRLFVSTNTVKSQLRSLYRKIDAHSRDEALQIAYRTGLI